ncbi:MAG: hypothetical protein IAG10_01540 [Planctomycetaceae bacterium]|nr:hypothetical protein [Planctomycetaceae bacterium]
MPSEPLTVRRSSFRISVEVAVLLGLASAVVGEAFVIHWLWTQDYGFYERFNESQDREKESEQKFYKALAAIRELEGRELVREGDNHAEQAFGDQLAEIESGHRIVVMAFVCAVCAGALEDSVQERCERVPWVHQVRFQRINPPESLVRIGQRHATVLAFIEMDGERTKEDLIESTTDRYRSPLKSFVTLLDRTMTE